MDKYFDLPTTNNKTLQKNPFEYFIFDFLLVLFLIGLSDYWNKILMKFQYLLVEIFYDFVQERKGEINLWNLSVDHQL